MKHFFAHTVRRLILSIALVLVGVAPAFAATPGLRAILDSNIPAAEPIRAVAMLGRIPTQADVTALQSLGLVAQPLKHLPMVLTKGTVSQIRQAVARGLARDMYIDRALQWHSAESTAAMSADITRNLGFDGSGIGIAIVDSGIDASHPDLASRVVRNVRVYSPEYLDIWGLGEPTGIVWPQSPALVIPFDASPYNNTDTIGHGTHVAGIAAADGSATPELIGVAPGADIIGYATGEVLFIFTALASFDDILATHEEYNIRVVNNSWGSGYHVFDPNEPINVGSKALHDAGITVVFSAGNDGLEMSTGVHSMAPWVIMSGSATVSKEKSDFSSSGLMFDNTGVAELDDDSHVHFDGDGLGLSHPDVSAPGSNINSTCTPTGWICAPTTPGGSGVSSGTSMSAPHMSGLAAVLLQARPELTPDQIAKVMQVTAVPMRDGAEFWQSGHGFVDAKAALDFVREPGFSAGRLDAMQAAAERRVLAARPYSVVASDHWEFVSLGATAFGLETRSFEIDVDADTNAIRASVSFPSDLGIIGGNFFYEWGLVLIDPDGNEVAESELTDIGVSLLHLDFAEAGITPRRGTWTVEAIGYLHLAQPALLWGHTVTVSVTQLESQLSSGRAGPSFKPDGELALSFAGGAGPIASPEGCDYDPAGASGDLSLAGPEGSCRAGTVGYAVNYGAGVAAEFLSQPLASDVVLGGQAELSTFLVVEVEPVYSVAFASGLSYQIDAVDDGGALIVSVAAGEVLAAVGPVPTFGKYPIAVAPTAVPAGARLRLQMRFSGVYTSAMRLLWGGDYAEAGLSLQTGKLVGPTPRAATVSQGDVAQPGSTGGAGAAGLGLLLLGLLGVLIRGVRREH